MNCAIHETFINGSLTKDIIILYHRLQNTYLHIIIKQIKQINCNYKKLIAYFNYFHTRMGAMNTVM